jgi:eukaryotic-like serine/threonine-protein kinase
MANRLKFNFSIRTKLFFLILIGFMMLISVIFWRVRIQADSVSMDTIERSLNQTNVILETKIESDLDAIREVATSIAKDGRVLPLVFEGESITLQDLSSEFEQMLEFDIMFFTDAEGTILARSDRPELIGRNLAGKSPLFDLALEGSESSGVIVSAGKLMHIVVVPIFDNIEIDIVRGSIALAYEFSKSFAQEVKALTVSDIGFFVFDRDSEREVIGVSSTYHTNAEIDVSINRFFEETPDHWKRIFNAENNQLDLNLVINQQEFFSSVHVLSNNPSQPLGFLMATQSRQELLKPFIDIQRTVFIVGIACSLIALVFAWLLALRISRPVVSLVSLTNDIEEGRYPETDMQAISGDEIGSLQRAVIRMGNSLKEKADLEQYLARLSDDFDLDESISLLQKNTTIEPLTTEHQDETKIVPRKDASDLSASASQVKNQTAQISQGSIVDDRYQIKSLIGSGAMGKVYLAKDLDLDEDVAVKLMDKIFFSQQESLDFKEEIRLARKITHRNIVRTFDYGIWMDFYYITMEYVLGIDLGKLIKAKGRFDVNIGVIMARQICFAMHAAHEQGILHLDLKPANMIITRQGILKIMDFGLAMKMDNEGTGKQIMEKDDNQPLIAGTPRFMAPEQFYGWSLDARTDIYAIGTMLYTIFEGHPPFQTGDFDKLALLHLNSAVDRIQGADGNFPEPLQAIILKSLAKKPDDRFSSVREMLDELNMLKINQ